jgi:hypothetical protein
MALFPALKTGAVAQAPFGAWTRFRTEVIRFSGGGEQRYALGGARRGWLVELSVLDEGEMQALMNFYGQHALYGVRFEFRDPFSGEVFEDCYFPDRELVHFASDVHGHGCVVRIGQWEDAQ